MNPSEQLWWACQSSSSLEVKQLLEAHHLTPTSQPEEPRGGLDLNWRNEGYYRWTALHQACSQGSHDIVSQLLQIPEEIYHLDVNPKSFNLADPSSHGITPLHCAVLAGHVWVTALLLEDPRVTPMGLNGAGESPLWTAAYAGKTEVIKVRFH